jgi:glycosyltransferase involved in cell wall biosynthesis
MTGGHAVPCSLLKGRSWGLTDDIVPFAVDAGDYPPHCGGQAGGVRICNYVKDRRKILLWDFHEEAFGGVPVRLVGHNPDMPGVRAAEGWDELKDILRTHRFYVHTADPRHEDGYNMATLEAMAAGLPVLGNRHPTSPVTDGVSGFLSDDPDELRGRAEQLLADPDLAERMGQAARKTVIERFPMRRFHEDFMKSIETARRKWASRAATL